MANHDIRNATLPNNPNKRPSAPTVTNLRSALTTHSSTSYSSDRLDAMSLNDMIYAARLHGLTVAGL